MYDRNRNSDDIGVNVCCSDLTGSSKKHHLLDGASHYKKEDLIASRRVVVDTFFTWTAEISSDGCSTIRRISESTLCTDFFRA